MGKGRLVILSGPSGVGKDTVIDAWRLADPSVERVVACTTRAPRVNEVDGVDYHFLSVEQFEAMAKAGGFLEYKRVFDNYYGTPAKTPEEIIERGGIAILKIDVQGARAVMPMRPDAITVFILPPSEEVLRERIEGRKTDSPEAITKRLQEAKNEITQAKAYQYQIVNEDIDTVVRQLRALTAR